MKRLMHALLATTLAVGLAVAPSIADSTTTGKKQAKVQIDPKCRKAYRVGTGDLGLAMDATIATWEGEKVSAQAAVADMKKTLADPQGSVSLDAMKAGAVLQMRSLSVSISVEHADNMKDVKDFEKQFKKCFSPRGKKQFGDAVALVRAGFREMNSAKYSLWHVWADLSTADVTAAEQKVQESLVNDIAGEPTFEQGMKRLRSFD